MVYNHATHHADLGLKLIVNNYYECFDHRS